MKTFEMRVPTVCRNLREVNGGGIEVENELCKGTTFRVILPGQKVS